MCSHYEMSTFFCWWLWWLMFASFSHICKFCLSHWHWVWGANVMKCDFFYIIIENSHNLKMVMRTILTWHVVYSLLKCKMCRKVEDKEKVHHISHARMLVRLCILCETSYNCQNIPNSITLLSRMLCTSFPLSTYVIGPKGRHSIFLSWM
jgi:hypothetical protein